MSDHLPSVILSALADGELSAEQLAQANEHLAGCLACTSNALSLSLLKAATAKAGLRYAPPPQLRDRLAQLTSAGPAALPPPHLMPSRKGWQSGTMGWAAAAALLLIFLSIALLQRGMQRSQIASAGRGAFITEVCDQHIAALAANLAPQVLSSDRHTVKPWFQGKLPFSFDLPDSLPPDTRLDGANLTYLHNQPVAQLLYSIGKHRVSVFVRVRPEAKAVTDLFTDRAGFHVRAFAVGDLQAVAVSDVDPARLADLIHAIEEAHTKQM